MCVMLSLCCLRLCVSASLCNVLCLWVSRVVRAFLCGEALTAKAAGVWVAARGRCVGVGGRVTARASGRVAALWRWLFPLGVSGGYHNYSVQYMSGSCLLQKGETDICLVWCVDGRSVDFPSVCCGWQMSVSASHRHLLDSFLNPMCFEVEWSSVPMRWI